MLPNMQNIAQFSTHYVALEYSVHCSYGFMKTSCVAVYQMTAAISTVEGALGLPSPQELAAGQEDQEQGEREKEGDENERERGKESDGKVETLAKLAESKRQCL